MDEQQTNNGRPVNPRRKQRSQLQIFKETYLPAVIACVALLLILIFTIGSIVRGIQNSKHKAQLAQEASIAQQEELERLTTEANALLTESASLARHFDYTGAISLIETFSGNLADFPELAQKHKDYTEAQSNLVLWDDPNQVVNLSFQILISDSVRAYADATYGYSYNQNFITTQEFTKILQQLYENGYILVNLRDVTSDSGPNELYLPEGKKPLILTQTNVNYYTYMLDSNGDRLPDKDGAGFASKLTLDANGNITCEIVDSEGNITTGAFDMVPILDSFVETHPDFSYKGAKAILSVTGYDGVFGYRTSPAAEEFFGKAYHESEVETAAQVVSKLRETGYEIACYTYENEPYGSYTAEQIRAEMEKWNAEVLPVIGKTDIFVFSRNSDIAPSGSAYSGDKFTAIQSQGYSYYLGFCEDGSPWYSTHGNYIRQGRILVTGANLTSHQEWFNGIFDPSSVLDANRGTVPA